MVTKDEIFELVKQYYKQTKQVSDPNSVPVSGKVFDDRELISAIDAVMEGWWTEGKYADQFEQMLARYLGVDKCSCVNSGSSANLIAISALTSHLIPKEKRLLPGDEIITTAASFPTTVNPIIQNGAVPVFVDVEIPTYNARPALVEGAITSRTKAIFLAHTMGNPFDIEKIMSLARKHDLWLIEDNCDALGSEYEGKRTGSFGKISTQSFYPAHHITTAEGGSVASSDAILNRAIRSIRDWGRDCWCRTGKSGTCNNR
jgi:CDP-6-deoxy-D-xylo-4-hexulose-3-dehydrase